MSETSRVLIAALDAHRGRCLDEASRMEFCGDHEGAGLARADAIECERLMAAARIMAEREADIPR